MRENTITGCRFLEGESGLMVVAVAGKLPHEPNPYTLRATERELVFKAGMEEVARFPFSNTDVFNRLTHLSMIGVIECLPDEPFAGEMTNTMYVQTMRAQP
jgi:hypothetical protein